MGASFSVQLDAFEGPLDLLLHLIRKHEIDIFDIPIHFITERFLDALSEMERLDLDVGGEFLVMAATLAQIKSRLLLPRPETADGDDEEDPRNELVQQLVEYQRYKDLAAQLDDRDRLGRNVFTRPAAKKLPTTPAAVPASGALDLFQLIEAFEQVKRRAGFRRQLEVKVERRTVRAEMRRVVDRLLERSQVRFWALVEETEDGRPALVSVVGVFLAVLELTRLGLSDVFQSNDDPGDLMLVGNEEPLRQWRALADEGPPD